jgi:hypothetical protein
VTALIPLTQGYVARVDDPDAEWLLQWTWRAARTEHGVYAARLTRVDEPGGPNQFVSMHRALLGLPPGRVPLVDHRNRDRLDNHRENLRVCSPTLNNANAPTRGNMHGFKGVVYEAERRRYRAELYFEGRRHRSTRYRTAEGAARGYDDLARRYFGPFALLNFPTCDIRPETDGACPPGHAHGACDSPRGYAQNINDSRGGERGRGEVLLWGVWRRHRRPQVAKKMSGFQKNRGSRPGAETRLSEVHCG